jgi:DNA (cytosine-5)-methyltransferase 1
MAKDIITLGDELNEHFHKDDELATRLLFRLLIEIYDQKNLAIKLNEIGVHVSRENLNKWSKEHDSVSINLDKKTRQYIEKNLLPPKPLHWESASFKFIDLFAGIGGIRKGFEDIGGKCVFTSELDRKARKTYLANHYVDKNELPYFIDKIEENPNKNTVFMDITQITESNNNELTELEKANKIRQHVPHHDVLLAGFPCQPFSIAGVSKKISLGRSHGFECDTQGTLFFDVEKIIEARKPKFFVLENVKNLKGHDKGNTFATIIRTLDKLGYWLLDITNAGKDIEDAIINVRKRKIEPTIIDGIHFTPQHRERVVLVGIRNDLIQKFPDLKNLSLSQIEKPENRYTLDEILSDLTEDETKKYTLTPNLWNYLYHYALKHKTKGNGFGFGLVDPRDKHVTTRTLSARYYKDGSEILVNFQGIENEYLESKKKYGILKNQEREEFASSLALKSLGVIDQSEQFRELIKDGEKIYDEKFGRYAVEFNPLYKTPRSLTPSECARLMGFEKPKFDRTKYDNDFKIVCANASAYKQFGNSVVVPVFRAVAKLLKPAIEMTKEVD